MSVTTRVAAVAALLAAVLGGARLGHQPEGPAAGDHEGLSIPPRRSTPDRRGGRVRLRNPPEADPDRGAGA
ncbi:hypothetical protein GCM10009679_19450 [Saccharothrix algeriensis]